LARFNAVILCGALLALAACTPGGTTVPSGGGGGGVITIDVNLTLHPSGPTPAGTGGGFSPLETDVAVGSTIRFTNSDTFAHTATFIGTQASFPAASPFSGSALTQSGNTLSQGWSSGSLAAGAASQIISVDLPGTYLYGCFYHYGAPMRGVIVAH
jgi:plastocyanin